MKFEFDPAKRKANAAKHGLDFSAAQELWADEERLVAPARSDAEQRQRLIGRAVGKLWTAIFTERGENIRIISVRRARDHEQEIYEQTEVQDDG